MQDLALSPLTVANFAEFGHVLVPAPHGEAGVGVNEGTALRYDHIAQIQNLRPISATLNVAQFRCQPRTLPFLVRTLEKHPCSTQLFVPLNASRYVVVVAHGGDTPDLATLAAFLADGRQGIAYHPGVWHHTLMALDGETDFSCMVWEDASAEDCVVRHLAEADVRQVSRL